MLQKSVYLLLTIFFYNFSSAQECTIKLSGYIIDEHDKTALDFANIYILETKATTIADEKGYYEFSNLCPGKYSIIIEHIGCETDTVQIVLSKNTARNFYLEHHTEELGEIITTATKEHNENTQTTSYINDKVLKKLEGKNLAAILSGVAGVNQLKTGTTISKPIIHGLYGDRIAVITNGVKLETQDWGIEHSPEIDPFAANSIQIIKGVGSVEYGTDALGGMVIIEPPVLQKKEHLKVNLSLIGQTNGRGITTSARIQQGFKNQLAYFLQGTYKRLGDQQAARYNLSNTGLQEGNLTAGFGLLKKGWDVNAYYSMFNQQIGILKSVQVGNITDLQTAIERDTPLIVEPFTYKISNPRQKVTHHVAKLNVIRFFENDNHIDLTYSVQLNNRKEFDLRRGGRSEIPVLNMKLLSNTILAGYHRYNYFEKRGIKLEGKSGINFIAKQNSNDAETGIRPLIPNYYQYSLGVFDIEKLFVRDFIFETGIRYEYTRFQALKFDRNNNLIKPKFNFHTYAINSGISWADKHEYIQLQTNLSVSSRFPNESELFSEGLHQGIAVLEFGNLNLKPETGIKWVNTIIGKYRQYFRAELSVYISKIYNYIYLSTLPEPVLTIRGAYPAFDYQQTNARLIGLDATITSDPVTWLTLSFRSSIVRGKNINTKDNIIYMPSDRINAGFEVHHDFKRVKNVHLGLEVQQTFKQVRTPKLITDFKAAPEAYTLINAETGFDLPITPKHQISFSIAGENITNRSYRDYLNRFRYFSDELGWNLIFRLKYSFT